MTRQTESEKQLTAKETTSGEETHFRQFKVARKMETKSEDESGSLSLSVRLGVQQLKSAGTEKKEKDKTGQDHLASHLNHDVDC